MPSPIMIITFLGVADQDARKSGVFVNFLGRPASTVRGPAMFAVRQNAPVIPGFIWRTSAITHHARLEAPLWPDPTLEGDDAITDLTQRYTDRISEAIRQRPTEYFWAHRRWKTKPPERA